MRKMRNKRNALLGALLSVSLLAGCSPFMAVETAAPEIRTAALQPGRSVASGTTMPQGSTRPQAEVPITAGQDLTIPDIVEANAPAVVTVAVRKIVDYGLFGPSGYQDGVGTGFFIDANGLIATNNHVVAGTDNVTIILHDGRQVPGQVLWTDPANDLAIVQVAKEHVAGVVTIGNSDNIRVGEGVVAIGNPMSADFAGTVTHGIISAKNRSVQVQGGVQEYIQIDAAINGGNSGGPLFDMKGEVIGINSAKIAQTGIEGIAFSIPINTLLEELGQAPETRDQGNTPVTIGVAVRDIPDELRAEYGAPVGIMVMEVVPGSPASEAGILPGDIITTFAGQEVTSTVTLNRIKSGFKPGDEVPFTIFRSSDNTSYEGTMVLVAASGN